MIGKVTIDMARDFSFKKRASRYDKGSMGKMSRKFYNLLLKTVELRDGCTVLDVGCGTGVLLSMMAQQKRIHGFGIDAEENMVAEAAIKCPGMGIRKSRAENMPFEKQIFDVVTVCMAYHHFNDKDGFASEAARVLKPGGALYIADPHFPAPVRGVLNAIFRLANVAGEFFGPDEITRRFEPFGFEPDSVAKDGYAQVVKLRRT